MKEKIILKILLMIKILDLMKMENLKMIIIILNSKWKI